MDYTLWLYFSFYFPIFLFSSLQDFPPKQTFLFRKFYLRLVDKDRKKFHIF